MNIKYYHDFIGADDVVNRFEILQNSSTTPKLIKATNEPFCIEYFEVKKLEPVQGSLATLKLISESIFQYIDLHTDDMREYMIKFYRSGQLYWVGYLDSELYNENLTDSAPYTVEFSGADFNILERLKFRNESENAYTDIASFITQLKRCFDKLGLPFQKLYIGCSTTPEGVTMTTTQTALHVLYIQSSNFYDEDGEPMSCREVVESILKPFGLMMVQRDASVYIYDLNTVKSGGVMKCYNFDTLSYIGDTAVNVLLGDISEIDTRSTEATFGFEEMVNNVTITSSLYANNIKESVELDQKEFSDQIEISRPPLNSWFFNKSTQIESLNGGYFALYRGNISGPYDEGDTMMGCYTKYQPTPATVVPLFRFKSDKYVTKVEPKVEGRYEIYPHLINLSLSAYASSTSQPIMQKGEEAPNSEVLKLHCNLYITNDQGQITAYYTTLSDTYGWVTAPNGVMEQGRFVLWFSKEKSEGSILNNWIINSNISVVDDRASGYPYSSEVEKGIYVKPDISGTLIFEITNKSEICYPKSGSMVDSNKVVFLLFDKINIEIRDREGKSPSTDDFEFKSYINKNVSSDYDEVTLKCISANEDGLPVGRANILKKVKDHYELQLAYTRAGQTDILERLLMCTIHSNFTAKNRAFSVDIRMTDNPILRSVTYRGVLAPPGMLVTGTVLDFHNAKMTIKAVGFSNDVDKLSNIPYK